VLSVDKPSLHEQGHKTASIWPDNEGDRSVLFDVHSGVERFGGDISFFHIDSD
jgi:hypothetical protein